VDLGVLANRNGNYGLRSPNILRFLGSAEQIQEVLLEAEDREPSPTFDPNSARHRIDNQEDVRSPLSVAQLADLVAPRNQVRLVLGSYLSGVDRVLDAIRGATVPQTKVETADAQITKLGAFRNTTGHHRIVIIDLDAVDGSRAIRLVEDAVLGRRAGPGTLGIVFVATPKNLDLWRRALEGGETWDRVGLVQVGRLNAAAWRNWNDEREFPLGDDTAAILGRSGGWLRILENAAVASRGRRLGVLESLDTFFESVPSIELLEQAGLDAHLRGVFSAICDYWEPGESAGTEADVAEIANLAGGTETDVQLLRLLGALVVEPGGGLRPEPVLGSLVAKIAED
jgi:hypothetical protein